MNVADIQASDPAWYQILTANLTTALQEVMMLADQRKAAAERRSGGKYLVIKYILLLCLISRAISVPVHFRDNFSDNFNDNDLIKYR